MAKLKVKNDNPTYVLSLNKKEALALLAVAGRVGGNPETSRRGYIDAIYLALIEEFGTDYYNGDVGNAITFAARHKEN